MSHDSSPFLAGCYQFNDVIIMSPTKKHVKFLFWVAKMMIICYNFK